MKTMTNNNFMCRFLHDPKASEGYVGCALFAKVFRFYKTDQGDWAAEKVIDVPTKKVEFLITINEPVDYMAQAVMILMRGKDILRAIGRAGPSNVFALQQNHKGQAPYNQHVHW